jgi:DNA-binding CsgD family transcriptional regulator
MSDISDAKKARLQSLDEREKAVLEYIIANKDVKIIDIANKLHFAESTTRNILTSIFTKLEVPERERDKRGYLVSEYAETFRGQDEKLPEVKPTSEIPSTPPQIPSKPPEEPKINITPPGRRVNPTALVIGILGGFALISVCVIGVLLFIIFRLNQPLTARVATNTPEVVAIIPTSTPTVPTSTPTITPTPTPIPPTPTITLTPTPKAFYEQKEAYWLRDNVAIYLDPEFVRIGYALCMTHDPGFNVMLWIHNQGENSFNARFDRFAFSAVDDTGKTYELVESGFDACDDAPGTVSEDYRSGEKLAIILAFTGQIPVEARYLYITVESISGSEKIVFRKDL